MKYEKELEMLTKSGHLHTSDIVLFLKETGIIDVPNLYNLFKIYMKVAHHEGYVEAMEWVKEHNNDNKKQSLEEN